MKGLLCGLAYSIMLIMPMQSFAVVYSGSNLHGNTYPVMESPPLKPVYDDKDSMNDYRKKVREYIKKSETYVNNADDDIKVIKSSRSAAIEQAKKLAEENDLETDF